MAKLEVLCPVDYIIQKSHCKAEREEKARIQSLGLLTEEPEKTGENKEKGKMQNLSWYRLRRAESKGAASQGDFLGIFSTFSVLFRIIGNRLNEEYRIQFSPHPYGAGSKPFTIYDLRFFLLFRVHPVR